MPQVLIDLKHAAFEPCYNLRLESKGTRLTVTAEQLRHWLHLPMPRNSEGCIQPREININTRHIDVDGGMRQVDDYIRKVLIRLRTVIPSSA